jgi:hypothetical protein
MKRIQRLMIVVGMVSATWSICPVAAASGQAQPDSQTSTKNSAAGSLHQAYGTIRKIEGSQLTIESRDGHMMQVDATDAIKSSRTIILSVGRTINLLGSYDTTGMLHAQSIQRAKSSSAGWPPDR